MITPSLHVERCITPLITRHCCYYRAWKNHDRIHSTRLLGYSLVSAFAREENSKGGVAIYKYKKTSMEMVENLNMEKKSIPLVCEIAVASVRLQGKGTFFVLAIYRPPYQNQDLVDQDFQLLSDTIR